MKTFIAVVFLLSGTTSYAFDVNLEWTASPDPGVVSYNVYIAERAPGERAFGPWTLAGNAAHSPVTCPDDPARQCIVHQRAGLADDREFAFGVTAVTADAESGLSNIATHQITPVSPPAPSGMRLR